MKAVVAFLLVVGAPLAARAFADVPYDVNDSGAVVGQHWHSRPGSPAVPVGFVSKDGRMTEVRYPGARQTALLGINDAGVAVGYAVMASGNMLALKYERNLLTPITYPGARATKAWRINDRGEILVQVIVLDAARRSRTSSYVVSGTSFVEVASAAEGRYAYGLNNLGWTVGSYYDARGVAHGYLQAGLQHFTIDVPGALWTTAYDVNDDGLVIGTYCAAGNGRTCALTAGFQWRDGALSTFDYHGAEETVLIGNNDAGEVVGYANPESEDYVWFVE